MDACSDSAPGSPAAFAPSTGLAGLDAVLQGIECGDNIVWQVESFDDYRALVLPYAEAARRQRRRLIYFRFASHPPLLGGAGAGDGNGDCEGGEGSAHGVGTQAPDVVERGFGAVGGEVLEVCFPRPQDGFDAFVDQVHGVIEAAGRETLYVFDCLSELAEAWQSDRMMGNFFRLTCPRLYDLDTVTYFGVYRNTHGRAGMEMIADTTQFLLDVFHCRGRLYLRPVKVQHRSAAAMNLIHAWGPGDRFRAVTDSGTVAEILAGSAWPGLEDGEVVGHWQRHFAAGRALSAARRAGRADPAAERAAFARLVELVFPDDPGLIRLVHEYLGLDDVLALRDRMIGNGSIGGKALGMLLARAVLRRDAPLLKSRMEAHDSFYVGTEVFDTFFVINGLWWVRRAQREADGFLHGLEAARARILAGHFPPETLHQFEGMLDYFGEWPFIVRSSSRLEDRYGNAFAGQYDSVFCVNQGPREARLAALLDAVRQVYASSLSEQALRYRKRRGLLQAHEQMALLIMRVSGTAGRRYFHPHAAGVGLSVNPYPWSPRIDMRAGVVRLVAGLGTRAVDRVDDDHTRLIALNAPELRPETSFGEIARHAQRRMDALDLRANTLVSGRFVDLVEADDGFPWALLTTREHADGPAFLTFDGLIERTAFVADLRTVLASLHAAYAHPVEVEFALNWQADGGYRINLLQCRPMQVRNLEGARGAAPPAGAAVLLNAEGAVIGPSRIIRLQRVVYVVPEAFVRLGPAERGEVARLVGRLNHASEGRCTLALGPGRWGSRDPWLGIPVQFGEINHFAAICEIVGMHAHLVPDVSLGTHFLNELIEADVLYFAQFPHRNGNRLDETALLARPDRFTEVLPDAAAWAGVIHVADFDAVPGALQPVLYADAEAQRVVVTLEAAPPPESL
ncbi:MAG: PEP/pyruvate-binding domain-containing protein [Rhodocyclaceae bacterium]